MNHKFEILSANFKISTDCETFWGTLAIAGVALGFPNDLINFPPIVLFWPIALFYLGRGSAEWRRAFLGAWLVSSAGCALALYWLYLPVHNVGGLPILPALACAALIAVCVAAQGGVFGLICYFLRSFSAWQSLTIAALSWYLLEYAYSAILGFPWLPLAGALAAWPCMIQAADIFGANLLGSVWLLAALALSFSMTSQKNLFFRLKYSLAGISIIITLFCYAYWKNQADPIDTWPEGENSFAALFVEGNVDQNQKWLPVFQRRTLDIYLRLTREGLEFSRQKGIEKPLLIWPETALPFFFQKKPDLAELARQCAVDSGCPLLFGAPGVENLPDFPEPAVFNRAFLISPQGAILGYYDKIRLVPFGEYLPTWLNLDFLKALLQGVGVYHAGNSALPLRYESLALGMLICYEGIFSQLAQERVANGANVLVDISNDGWFGNTPAARQHLFLTALRCVEQNRWLLRATNTGISAAVDARGRIAIAGPQFKAGFLPVRARLETGLTVYHRIACWLPVCAIAVILCLLAGGWFQNKAGAARKS